MASGTAAAGGTSKTYTNDDLRSLVTSLKDAQGQQMTVVPAAQLDQALTEQRQVIKKAKITPKACGVFASKQARAPKGSSYAAGTSQSAAKKTITTITVIAVKDAHVLAEQVGQSKDAVGKCSSFKITAKGKSISSKLKPLQVSTDGEKSFGGITTETLPNGQEISIMAVTGIQGNLAATAMKVGAKVPDGAKKELVKLVNEVLAKG